MAPEPDYATMSSDIILKGSLRKAKNWNKRFFVLRDGIPPKLEYYENERKWRGNNNKPKKRINLEKPWNIDKKKDSKHEFLVVIFTEDEYFSMAADNAETQQQWVSALQRAVKPADPGSLLFKHMWHVVLENKELEVSKSNLLMNLHGPHRVCLTHDQMVFVHANSSGGGDRARGEPIEIRITTIRVCGHKEGMFFIEPGRASGIGSGKLWMDLNDEVMAAHMHTTILNVMYALKQEEDNSYRGRSYSSGSNSGRMRSVRSHHNNPPPSQIGMGKMAGVPPSSKQRIRCDSLPASHVGGLNDSRLRTGSEGENTMKRPSRINSMRGGSISPGVRSRLWNMHSKRGPFSGHHHHNNINHTHTTSLPGSCNSSSTTSSSEHLNNGLNSSSDFSSCGCGSCVVSHLPPSTSSPAVGDAMSADECGGGHSPTQGYLQPLNQRNGLRGNKHYHCNGRSVTPEFPHQANATPPIHEDCAVNQHYCTKCFAHIPLSQQYNEIYHHSRVPLSKQAPPPPSIQPASNPLGIANSSSSVANHEYANVPVHSRTHSLDDSCGTATSSLSASPQQNAGFHHNGELNQQPSGQNMSKPTADGYSQSPSQCSSQDDGSSFPCTPTSSSPKGRSSIVQESFSASLEDYTPMNFDHSSKYPHHNMSSVNNKSSSSHNSIIAKLVSFAGVSSPSSSHNNHGAPPGSDYTPMNLQASSSDAKNQTTDTMNCGYVPMRSFAVRSLPQEIEHRRRSVPDAAMRNAGNHNAHSSPPYGYSPAEKQYELMNPLHSFCPACMDRYPSQKHVNVEDSEYCKMQPALYNCHLKLSCDMCSDLGKDVTDSTKPTAASGAASGHLTAPVIDASSRISTPSPSTKTSDDYLCMRSVQEELRDSAKADRSAKTEINDSTLSNMSSSPADSGIYFKETEMNGYLPMSPVNVSGQSIRSKIVSGILSVAMENSTPVVSPAPQYPHQIKDRNSNGYSTNSLDRPNKAHRSKRPKSLGFRHTNSNSARRTQSLRHGKKSAPESLRTSLAPSPPNSTANTQPPPSPGGEYVNIDFSKAQEQLQSPYVMNVTSSKDISCSPRLSVRNGGHYADMSYNGIGHRDIQTNI